MTPDNGRAELQALRDAIEGLDLTPTADSIAELHALRRRLVSIVQGAENSQRIQVNPVDKDASDLSH